MDLSDMFLMKWDPYVLIAGASFFTWLIYGAHAAGIVGLVGVGICTILWLRLAW